MKKLLFGIFAHPDDEAFGPSASLYHAARSGTDVHLILATDGEAGTNTDNIPDLAALRLEEWKESGKRIGATSGLALHYPDGGLCNDLYLEIAEKIINHIHNICGDYNEKLLIEFMTFDHDGVSGHLDHIAISFITTYVYLSLQKSDEKNITIGRLLYYCLPEAMVPEPDTRWLYMPQGKKPQEVDEIFDFQEMVDKKLFIMQAHHSQRKDMEEIILTHQNKAAADCRCDHFRYYK